jgi:hypothetical protein
MIPTRNDLSQIPMQPQQPGIFPQGQDAPEMPNARGQAGMDPGNGPMTLDELMGAPQRAPGAMPQGQGAFVDQIDNGLARLIVGQGAQQQVVTVPAAMLPRGTKEGAFVPIPQGAQGAQQ